MMNEIMQLFEQAKKIDNKTERLKALKKVRIKLLEILINPDLSKVELEEAKALFSKIVFSLN